MVAHRPELRRLRLVRARARVRVRVRVGVGFRVRVRALTRTRTRTRTLTLTRSVDEPPAPGAAFTGAERAGDAAVFAALGEGDLKINAKRLFCLCDGAPEFESMIQRYMEPISM